MTALLLATLCAAAPQPVLVWHAYRGAEEQALTTLVDRFNAEHPEYQVQLLAIPYDAYAAKLTSAIPTGHGPDLFIYAQERVGGWARESYLATLDDEAAELGGDLTTSALSAMKFEGHSYGLPLSLKSAALYYNRKLVPVPPATTDDLERIAVAQTNRSKQKFGLAYAATDFYLHAAWLTGFGGTIFQEPGHRAVLDSPEAIDALKFVRKLALDDKVIPEEPSATLVTALFESGNAAMVISGPWLAGELHDVDYGVASLPTVSSTGKPMRPLLTVEGALISKYANEPAGARAFARFLVSRDAAIERALVGRQVVATKSAYGDPRVGGDALLSAFAKQAEAAVPMDNTPAMGAVWEPERRALVSVLSSGLSPADALAQAQRRLLATTRAAPPVENPLPYVVGALVILAGAVVVVKRRSRRAPVAPRSAAFDVGARAYAYVLPAAIGLAVLVFIPFGAGVGLAFFHHQEGNYTFVGLRNFIDILASRDYRITEPMNFYFTLGVTILWTVVNVVAHVSLGVALALVLRDPLLKLKGVYRVLLIVPWAIPNYITALIWKGMFHRQFGAISALLRALGIEPISWFTHFSTAFAANVVTNTWLGFPFMMVVTLGALQSIPTDLYEAAEVDGASRWAQFRHITLPLLRPALLPAIILGGVWTFNMFNIIYLVSGGEPGGTTDILVSEAYRWAFQRNEQFGFAAAYSTLIFLVLLGYSALTRRVGKDPALEGA